MVGAAGGGGDGAGGRRGAGQRPSRGPPKPPCPRAAARDLTPRCAAFRKASNITTPSGTLEQCYDALGRAYSVPPFCLAPPANQKELLQGAPKKPKQVKVTPSSEVVTFKCRLVEVRAGWQLRLCGCRKDRRPHAPAPPPQRRDVELKMPLGTPVRDAKQRYVEAAGEKAPPLEHVRFFFMGRECNDAELLQTCRITDGIVITVLLRQ